MAPDRASMADMLVSSRTSGPTRAIHADLAAAAARRV
jgi:hypothetical protein